MATVYNVGDEDQGLTSMMAADEAYMWSVYWYESGSYEGSGEFVALRKEDGKLLIGNLGHCSCYGPEDGWGTGTILTVEEFLNPATIFDCLVSNDRLEDKVRELLRMAWASSLQS